MRDAELKAAAAALDQNGVDIARAIGSVYGMNIIGKGTFDPLQLAIVLVVMLVCVLALFRWAKAQGWW